MEIVIWVVGYDIADDRRRQAVSALLSGYGARVQFSLFECDLPTAELAREVQTQLRTLIDEHDDQVRMYPLPTPAADRFVVLGRRRLEERADFWII